MLPLLLTLIAPLTLQGEYAGGDLGTRNAELVPRVLPSPCCSPALPPSALTLHCRSLWKGEICAHAMLSWTPLGSGSLGGTSGEH